MESWNSVWGGRSAMICAAALLVSASIEAATIWTGNGLTDSYSDAANWDNNVPTLSNIGTVSGAATVTYSNANELNDAEVSFEALAGLSPSISGGNLQVTGSILHLSGTTGLDVSGRFRLGNTSTAGSTTMTLGDSATVDVSRSMIVGHNQQAFFTQSGSSAVDVSRSVVVGNRVGASGSSYMKLGGTLDIGQNLTIKNSSLFQQSGGSFAVTRTVNVNGAGSIFSLNGGTGSVGRDLLINTGGDFNQLGGVLSVTRNTRVRTGSTATVSGGILTTGGRLEVDAAQFTQNGGIISADNLRVTGAGVLDQFSGSMSFTNGADVRGASQLAQASDITVGGSLTLRDGSSWDTSSGLLSVSQSLQMINNNNTFTQAEGNVVLGDMLDLLTGSGNTYDLSGGRLEVMNSIDIDAANSFVWQSGGTMGVHGSSTSIQYNGDLIASSGAILDLNSSTEFLAVSGSLTINDLTIDGYDLNLAAERSTTMVVTGNNLLISGAPVTGEANITYANFSGFDGATQINFGDSFDPNTEDVYWYNQVGNDVSVYWSLSIPEPSSLCLLALSFGGLLLTRKRDTV